MIQLIGLAGDVLIYIVSFLQPPDIISLAKTCRSFYDLTRLRIVWTNARTYHVIANGYPLLSVPPDRLSTSDLIKYTRHAFGLGERWVAGIYTPRRIHSLPGNQSYVTDVRFLPGFNRRLLLTIIKQYWKFIFIWDISGEEPRRVCAWYPHGATLGGFTLNSEVESEGTIALSLDIDHKRTVKVLSLKEVEGDFAFHEIHSVVADMDLTTLFGDFLALSNAYTKTMIWNWRLGTCALLDSASVKHVKNYNPCLQVVFAHQSILVLRAMSLHLFTHPVLRAPADPAVTKTDRRPPSPSYAPLAHRSFYWIGGASISRCPHVHGTQSHPWPSLSMLIRGGGDEPGGYRLGLYALDPNPDYLCLPSPASPTANLTTPLRQAPPYIFPPRRTHTVLCPHSDPQCKGVILGRLGTAVWIQPRDRSGLELVDPSGTDKEVVTVGVFPGSPVAPSRAKAWSESESEVVDENETEGEEERDIVDVMRGKRVYGIGGEDCVALDYDEELGRVVLLTSFSKIFILEL